MVHSSQISYVNPKGRFHGIKTCPKDYLFIFSNTNKCLWSVVVSVLCKSSHFCLDPKGFSDFLLRRVSSVQIQPLLFGSKGFQWLSSTSCQFCANPAPFVWTQRVSVTFFYVVLVLCKFSLFCWDPKGFSDFLLCRVSSVQIQPLLLGPKGFQWLSSTSCQFCANSAPFVWIQRVSVTFFYVVSVLCKSSPFCLDPKGFSDFLLRRVSSVQIQPLLLGPKGFQWLSSTSCQFCANPAPFVWIQRVPVTFFYVVSVLCKSSPFCLDPKGFSAFLTL